MPTHFSGAAGRGARLRDDDLRVILRAAGRCSTWCCSGIGADGHAASVFAGSPAITSARTVVAVTAPAEPPSRLTLTLPVIAAARRIGVLAAGPSKAPALAAALGGGRSRPPRRRARPDRDAGLVGRSRRLAGRPWRRSAAVTTTEVRCPGVLRRDGRPRAEADLPCSPGVSSAAASIDLPIIGVARAEMDLERFRAFARQSLEGARRRRRGGVCASSRRACATSTATTTSPTPSGGSRRRSATPHGRSSTSRFRLMRSPPSCAVLPPSAATSTRASSSRSRSAATWPPPVRSTSRSRSASPSRRSSGSTTISARNRSRTCCTSASRMPSSNRSGTGSTCAARRSRWRKRSASKGRGRFYDSVGAIRDVVQNHLLELVALLTMERAGRPRHRRAARREVPRVPGDAAAVARTKSCEDSIAATAARTASIPSRTSRRSPRSACTSTAGAGPASRSTFAPASACR